MTLKTIPNRIIVKMPQFYNYYIIYGDKFGFVDLEAIEKLIKNRLCEKIILFLSTEPHKNVEKALEKYPSIEVRISKRPKKDAKRYMKDLESQDREKTVVIFPLEVVADRSMWLDVC